MIKPGFLTQGPALEAFTILTEIVQSSGKSRLPAPESGAGEGQCQTTNGFEMFAQRMPNSGSVGTMGMKTVAFHLYSANLQGWVGPRDFDNRKLFLGLQIQLQAS